MTRLRAFWLILTFRRKKIVEEILMETIFGIRQYSPFDPDAPLIERKT